MHRLRTILLTGALALVVVAPAVPAGAHPGVRPGSTVDRAPGVAVDLRSSDLPVRSTGDTDLLSVRGAGPFRIGASLTRLTAAGLIDWTAVDCEGVVVAGVTGEWAGKIMVAFRNGRLVEVGTATAPPRSPAGAGVGMSFAEVAQIYGTRGTFIRNDAGDATAYLVRFGNRVELFTGHPIRPGVGYFQAGTADHVERAFRQGRPC
ncbi:hypothetical protein [Micromonospora sp. HUAS LYJ1]|uniref:hypothetical protein n=1 Tax=Micromonospora sp. HUAS LYJ1 TaxID=3061626 RepID=UPI0026723125|nr:hypothetical protein [Micromonospora sp. HUAS LYJ1]WKU05196.1 hypothetical protein Q2K16_31340 [Micromonospora sp. HUAS LYJ1]